MQNKEAGGKGGTGTPEQGGLDYDRQVPVPSSLFNYRPISL